VKNLRLRKFAVGILISQFFLIPITYAPSASAATCTTADYGKTQTCAAPSAQAIKDRTGTNINDVYWILVDGVATQVYSIMDSAMNGGGWMLAMKGANTGDTFGYSANYWTTTNTLNSSSPAPNWGSTNTDAKYAIFNSTLASEIMALFPDAAPGGAISNQSYGHTWVEQMPTPNNTITISGASNSVDYTGKTLLDLFSDNTKIPIRDPAITTPYDATSSAFSRQGGYKFFGYNYRSTNNDSRFIKKVRWGFGWNNEGDEGSNDVTGGIGLDFTTRTSTQWSAGDIIECCEVSSGVNRQMKFELYVKAYATSPGAVRNLGLSGASASATLTWDHPTTLGGAALEGYTVEISYDDGLTWPETATVSGFQTSAVISGLVNGNDYQFRVYGTNLYGDGVPNVFEWRAGTPDLPKNIQLSAGDETLTATWDLPNFTGVTAISDYSIEYSTNGTTWSTLTHTPSDARSLVLTGLTNGEQYSLRIGAIIASGTGLKAVSTSVIPAGVVTPRFESTTANSDGFVSTITNYDSRFCWSATSSQGSASITPLWSTELTPYMEYKASDYNPATKVWRDSSGNSRDTAPSFVSGTLAKVITAADTNGSRCSFPVVQGGTNDQFRFNNPAMTGGNYTLFHVTRYNGGTRGRIVNGIDDGYISGFWNGQAGVAYHEEWITPSSGITPTDNWVISTSASGLYRANGVTRSTGGGIDYIPTIGLNAQGESSDYQVAELILFDRRLTDTEIKQVEDYLGGQYGINIYNNSGVAPFTSGKLTVHHVTGGESVTASVALDSNVPGFLNGSSSVSATATKAAPSKPLALSAIAGEGEVAISWIAPDRVGGAIESYTVVATTGGQECIWTSGPLTCTVTGLPENLDRYFVTAYNSEGVSPASDYIVAGIYQPILETTTVTAEGFTVNIPNYTTNSDGVALSWNAAVDAGGTMAISWPNFTVTTVMGGETATATVQVSSGISAVRTATTTISVQALKAAPSIPLGVGVTTTVGQAVVTWSSPIIPGGPITGYTATPSPTATPRPSPTAALTNSFKPDREKTINDTTMKTPGNVTLRKVTGVKAALAPSIGLSTYKFSWAPNSVALSYSINLVTPQGKKSFTTETTSINLEELSPGAYTLEIQAIDGNGKLSTPVLSKFSIPTPRIVKLTAATSLRNPVIDKSLSASLDRFIFQTTPGTAMKLLIEYSKSKSNDANVKKLSSMIEKYIAGKREGSPLKITLSPLEESRDVATIKGLGEKRSPTLLIRR
jgi:hypothetical protein